MTVGVEQHETARGAKLVAETRMPGQNAENSDGRGQQAPAAVPAGVDASSVEAALGHAIRLAADAGQWAVVAELGRELSARRLVREAPGVASLEAERLRAKRNVPG